MINVIGLGYIGLPTALMMASHGVEIVGTDYVVIMVNHNQIKENMDKLKGKVVFDTRKCCDLPGTYRL